MAIITFTSDFGYSDHYVAAVKAKIFSVNHTQKIVDITHGIKKFDLLNAAYVFKSVYKDFPLGTVHIVAVNSLDSPTEKSIAVKFDNHYIICSDNGFISLLMDDFLKPTSIVNLLEKSETKNTSFPAKDIYVPAALILANEGNFYELGPEVESYKPLALWPLGLSKNEITGNVIRIDDYGNAILNITKKDFEDVGKSRSFNICFTKYSTNKICTRYSEVAEGDLGAIFNSNNFLEIFINKGNASELMGLQYLTNIYLEFDIQEPAQT